MDGPNGTIMHAELQIGNSIFMLGAENPQTNCLAPVTLKGTPVSLYLYVENVDAAFNQAVSAGAKVEMPVSDMFWGDRYGQVSDPSGHRWGLTTHQEDVTPEQMTQRAKKFFAEQAQSAPPRPQSAGSRT